MWGKDCKIVAFRRISVWCEWEKLKKYKKILATLLTKLWFVL